MRKKKRKSPLEVVTRQALGLNTIVGDDPFSGKMLARALRKLVEGDPDLGELGETDPAFRDRFLLALADAIEERDPLCEVRVERTGKIGRLGNGGMTASDRAYAIAFEVSERTALGDKQSKVLEEIEERFEISRTQVWKDLKAGRAAIAEIRKYRGGREPVQN